MENHKNYKNGINETTFGENSNESNRRNTENILQRSQNASTGKKNHKDKRSVFIKRRCPLNDIKNQLKVDDNISQNRSEECFSDVLIDLKNITIYDTNQKNYEKELPSCSSKNDENLSYNINLPMTPVRTKSNAVTDPLFLERKRRWEFSPFKDKYDANKKENMNKLLINDGIRSNTVSRKYVHFTESTLLDYLRTSDYLDNFIHYTAERENKKKIQIGNLSTKFIPVIRIMVVNWLLKLQQFYKSDASVFFTAVQLLDTVLHATDVPSSQMQAVGIAAYWIAMKYCNRRDIPKGKDLQNICGNKYSAKHIIRTEKKVLHIVNFDIPREDPMLFVRYYIMKMTLSNFKSIWICSNYILDTIMLERTYFDIQNSRLAAAAVTLSLKMIDSDLTPWQLLAGCHGYYTDESLRPVQEIMWHTLCNGHDIEFDYREPFKKYNTREYDHISERLNVLIKLIPFYNL